MQTLHMVAILTLAISSNFDNLAVGIAYGIRGTCVRFPSNLLIALITGAGTLLSMLAGTTLYRFLRPELATLIGGLAMIGIGGPGSSSRPQDGHAKPSPQLSNYRIREALFQNM